MVKNTIIDILKDKKQIKEFFVKDLGLKPSVPLVVFVMDSSVDNSDKLLIDNIYSSWGELDASAVLLDKGHKSFKNKKGDISQVKYDENTEARLLVAGDILIDFTNIKIETVLFNRLVSVSQKREGLENYSPAKETGNSFMYKKKTAIAIFGSLSRALETSKLRYDWKHIVKNLV